MTNNQIMDLCEGKRLWVARVIHLGALAALGDQRDRDLEEALADLLGDLEGPSAKHVVEAIPGLRKVDVEEMDDGGPPEESVEYVDDARDFMDAAINARKLGFLLEVHTPNRDGEDEGHWGWYTSAWFYGETFEVALFDAAKALPALADRSAAPTSEAKTEGTSDADA